MSSWSLLHLSVSLWPAAWDSSSMRNSHRLPSLSLASFSPFGLSVCQLWLFPQTLLATWLRLALTFHFTQFPLNPWCLHLFGCLNCVNSMSLFISILRISCDIQSLITKSFSLHSYRAPCSALHLFN